MPTGTAKPGNFMIEGTQGIITSPKSQPPFISPMDTREVFFKYKIQMLKPVWNSTS